MGYDWKSNSPLQTLPPGANIFGILPGKFWNTKKDRPLIIGAHWDTVANSTGKIFRMISPLTLFQYLIENTKIWTEIQDQDIPVIFLLENATLLGCYAFTHWMVMFNSYKLSFPFLKSVKKGLRRRLRQLALPLPIFLQVFIIFRVCFSGILIDYFMRTVLCIINGTMFWEKAPEIDEIISENVGV